MSPRPALSLESLPPDEEMPTARLLRDAEHVRAMCAVAAANFTTLAEQSNLVVAAAERITSALRSGGKVLFCGNGGSAADSQHLAAEFMGRFLRDRAPLPAMALTVDTSALTAIGNDYGFDDVFARQLRGVGNRADVLVALSTSGNSRNVLAAIAAARHIGMTVIGLTGEGGGAMGVLCDVCFRVPSVETPRIQEMHIALGHMICELVENAMIDSTGG